MGNSHVVPKPLRRLVTSLLLLSRLDEEAGVVARPWIRAVWLGDTSVSDSWFVRAGGTSRPSKACQRRAIVSRICSMSPGDSRADEARGGLAGFSRGGDRLHLRTEVQRSILRIRGYSLLCLGRRCLGLEDWAVEGGPRLSPSSEATIVVSGFGFWSEISAWCNPCEK